MIFQYFLLSNLVSLCMKIINSVVLVGLYYGFLTTFSIGPSYLFLLRAQVMEEGTEKKVSATTGFFTGQLLMFISIYYAPLHLALGRPHTITVLALPYLLFHFFWNNDKHFFDYVSTTRNSMRNFNIQCVFLNNLIFQLFNHSLLPSSMLARLINIYMFRCNNKILFVTSSFVGWLIGHILFIKWLGLVLVWIRQNLSIRPNKYIRFNKYFLSELINSMSRIFIIILFITCIYYLGKIPSPIFTKKLKETPKMEQRVESEEEILVNGKEDKFHLLLTGTAAGYKKRPVFEKSYINIININENSNKVLLKKNKTFINIFFDSNRWNRPFRYIKNTHFGGTFRNEMSQYFFQICKSDGKERIFFTYLPSLSIFFEMIKKKIYLTTYSTNELPNPWFYINKKKGKSLNNVFINRIEALDKEFISLNILETRTRLCNDHYKKEYISKIYDPFLNKSYKKKIYKNFLHPTPPKIMIENLINNFGINRIHGILILNTDYQEFEHIKNIFDKKPLSTEIVDLLTLLNKVIRESVSTNLNYKVIFLASEKIIVTKIFKYLLTQIITDVNYKKILKKSTIIKEISKKVLKWSYKLITELEQQSREYYEDAPIDHEISSRKFKDVVIFKANKENADSNKDINTLDQTDTDEVSLIHYSQQSDFRRDIIKGSMRSQRRKLVIYELFQANVHSPLFFDRIQKNPLFSFYIYELIKLNFRNWVVKDEKVKVLKYTEEQIKRKEKKEKNKRKENARIELAESWDNIPFAQGIRGCMLIIQSILRKYILLPLFIIIKNIVRIFLFQLPEWSEDFQEWDREIHVKCTYNGIPLSETEFPKNWLTDGIQIKILFPFYFKPWKKSKLGSYHKDLKKKYTQDDFCFLTVLGMEAKLPFGSPRKRVSFFKPIFIELKKNFVKLKKKYFRILIVFKEKKIKELSKVNRILSFRLIKVKTHESIKLKKEKYSLTSNNIINESLSQIPSSSYTNYSFTEKKMMNLIDRTTKILNKIERIKKEKKKITSIKKNIIINDKKTNYNAKILKKRQILQQINDKLNCKLPFFFKFFIESIYTNIFLSSINIIKKNTEFFIKLKKKITDKSISKNDNKIKKEIVSKKNKNTIPFISKSLNNNNISNSKINSHTFNFYDLSYVSQAYVFYKLSQIQVSNFYKYKLIPFFIKHELKDYFEKQGIVQSKFRDNKLTHYKINQWKIWLRGYYQYNLSHIKWSRLTLTKKKWRNKIYQRHRIKSKILSKHQSYEYEIYKKDQLIDSKKRKELKVYSLSIKKGNYKKDYRYNLLSYNFLNYENKTEYFFYKYMFKENNKQNIYYMSKETFFGMIKKIPINNYLNLNNNLRKTDTLYMQKIADIKYFNWNLINFYFRQKVEIEDPIVININRKQNTKNSPIIYKKEISYFMITEKNLPNYNKGFLNWMEMNKKILKYPISNLEFWFFPEFVLFYNAYKKKPWLIPSKLLILNFKLKNKKINEKEKDSISQENLVYVLSQKKKIEEICVMSDVKKGKKKKQYKNKTEAELDFFLKRYLLFQLRWDDALNQRMINNIKVYCLLLRRIEQKKITISSIHKREMSLDIMFIKKNLTLTELIKKGVLIIESIRLYGKNDGQFFMYQTINISLIHRNRNKYQNNKKYQNKIYSFKNKFYKAISRHQRLTKNINKNSFSLIVPENILSFKHRRKFRILFFFYSNNTNDIDRNIVFCNKKSIKNNIQISTDNKNLNKEKNKLITLKHFIWPNYRLEDLACMNRYWFNTNNGSHLSMLRVHMYPRFKFSE